MTGEVLPGVLVTNDKKLWRALITHILKGNGEIDGERKKERLVIVYYL